MERRYNNGFNRYSRTPIRRRGRGGRGRGRGGERGRGKGRERGGGRGRGGRHSRSRRPMSEERYFKSEKRVQIYNQHYQDKIVLSISYEILKELISKNDNEIIQILSKYKDSSKLFEENTNFIKEMIEIMVELL